MRKTTRAKESPFLLERYYHLGWLNRRYLVNCKYIQPYSAEDRLLIGKQLYEDFIYWQRGIKLTHAYENGYVDVDISHKCEIKDHQAAERFRHMLNKLSKSVLPIIYRIVLEEREIPAPKTMSAREKLYFNDEVKGLLCRGLDELITKRYS